MQSINKAISYNLILMILVAVTPLRAAAPSLIRETVTELQVAYDVDVVVVGGSTSAVSCALKAHAAGARVFLFTDRPYLGEDICAHLRLERDASRSDRAALLDTLFGQDTVTTPLAVKKQLDRHLLDAGIPFLTGAFPGELLLGPNGRTMGITMINRSGMQMVRARVVVDATPHAMVARQAPIPFAAFKPGVFQFTMRVIGGEQAQGKRLRSKPLPFEISSKNNTKRKPAPVVEYTFEAHLPKWDTVHLARIEQQFRNALHRPNVLESSERMDFELNCPLERKDTLGAWPGAQKVDLAYFWHERCPEIMILGRGAALSKAAAESLSSLDEMNLLAERLGAHAASTARAREDVIADRLDRAQGQASNAMTVRHEGRPLRTGKDHKPLSSLIQDLPVWGSYDVVVVGGGTSGAPAGMGAAESGASTLVIEYLDELGGVGTAGLIGKYWYGLRHGFTARIDKALGSNSGWDVISKSEWLRQGILKAGGEVWFGSFGCGVVKEGERIRGVVVATPQGRGVVLAKTVIDSTGNADLAYHAGAETAFSISKRGHLSVQLAGYPHRNLGDSYNNTCLYLVDDGDAIDCWHLMVTARQKMGSAFDAGQLIDSRERRRICGEYMLTTMDILAERTFNDTILQMNSNFDAASFPTDPMLLVKDMKGPVMTCSVPYRCFIPKGIEGLYAIGLGASMDRDAMTLTRMQPDLQNQGYAIGIAAALCVKKNLATRTLPIKELQAELIGKALLPAEVSGQKDSFPVSVDTLQKAVEHIGSLQRAIKQQQDQGELPIYKSLALIIAHPELSRPLLRTALAKSTAPDAIINYAKTLAAVGDGAGRDHLIAALREGEWGSGFHLTGHRKENNTYTEMDRMLIALGHCEGGAIKEVLREKLKTLDPKAPLSHYYALMMALEGHIDSSFAPLLVEKLEQQGFSGHARSLNDTGLLQRPTVSGNGNDELNAALREMVVASLLFRAGDADGRARRILEAYAQDRLGHLQRFAEAQSSHKTGTPHER